jgi:hypothetical protein
MTVEWDFTKPTDPVELGSRSGDVVSVRGGDGAMLTVMFPNGCVISSSFDSANALRTDPTSRDNSFIDSILVTHTMFDGDDDLTTVGREQAAIFSEFFDVDDTTRSDLDRYLDEWDQVVADPSQRPFPQISITPTSFTSLGTDDWRGVLRFERRSDALGVDLDIYFDPLAEPGSDAQNCDETTG